MITACELCAKITVENALREEATRIAKMQTAKLFAEEVIDPILRTLREIPDHMKIGYRYTHVHSKCGLWGSISAWHNGKTSMGNPKKFRSLENEMGNGDFSMLDYEYVNQYLAEFGFQISVTTEKICTIQYSTSTRDEYTTIDVLYLSMTCPMENC